MTLAWEDVRADALDRAKRRPDRFMALESPRPERIPASYSHDRRLGAPVDGSTEIVDPGVTAEERQECLTYLLHLHQLLLTVQEANGWTPADVAATLAEMPDEVVDKITADARRAMLSSPLWRFLLHEARSQR